MVPLNSFQDCFNLLGLAVKFSEDVRECHVCFAHMFEGFISILILEEYKGKCEFAFSSLNISLTEFNLEKVENNTKVLLSLFIIVSVYCCVSVVLNGAAKVLLNDELAPYLNDLLIEVLGIDDLALLLEDLTHIIIAATQIDALRTIELRLEVNGMRQFIKSLLSGISFGSGTILV